jgi:type IX secretion system PorP/SprF family membrane protein
MKKYLILFICFCGLETINAQQDEQMSLYMQNPLYFNPAYAGSRQSVSLVSLARFQWIKFDGAPQTQWFSIHTPLPIGGLGIGAHMVNDKIGSRNRTAAYLDASASIQLNKKNHRLAIGVSGGADFLSFDFSGLNVIDVNDPYYGATYTSTKPNVGAGIYYYGDRHYLGLSSPRLLEMKVTDPSAVISSLNKRHYFLTGGFVFDINSVIQCKPATMVKYTPDAPLTIDGNLSFLFYEKFWLGAMYRFNESFGMNAIFKIKNAFQVGYAYDFPINGLRTYQNGSHEIILTYDFNFKKRVYNSPRYF